MKVVIILGLFSGLFAYLSRYKKTQWGLKVSFGLIFVFLALRYDFGNDYETYLKAFGDLNQYGLFSATDNLNNFEPGWVVLNRLFRPLGFFGMTAVLALVNSIVYYYFIKTYVPIRYYWMAVCLYVFDPEFMLIQLSAMRQTVAILLFIISLNFLSTKRPVQYFLCIGVAMLFHTSAVILLPVYLLGLFVNWHSNIVNKSISGVIAICLFALLYIIREYVTAILNFLINSYYDRYLDYQNPGELHSGLGVVYGLGILFLAIYYGNTQNKRIESIVSVAMLNYFLIPLNIIISMITRIDFYFYPAIFVAYPVILNNFKSPVIRVLFLTLTFAFAGYKFYGYINFEDNPEHYGTYKTIFSASKWY